MPVSQLLVAAGHPCSLNGRHTTLVYASILTWASPLCWCVTPSTFSLTRTLVIGFGATLDKPGGYLKILHLVASVKNFSPNKIDLLMALSALPALLASPIAAPAKLLLGTGPGRSQECREFTSPGAALPCGTPGLASSSCRVLQSLLLSALAVSPGATSPRSHPHPRPLPGVSF